MKQLITVICCLFFAGVHAQNPFTRKQFFKDTAILHATIITDIANLTSGRIGADKQNGSCVLSAGDSVLATASVNINARGHMRRKYCHMPPLKINFSADSLSSLHKLGNLKLVLPCNGYKADEQLLIKEYLIYKMYNLVTDLSFRVRLFSVTLKDIKGNKKETTQYAFFIEDPDQLAKRNDCVQVEDQKFLTDQTDRQQVTLVSIFQYMIGNTDWSVPVYHNIKLVRPKDNPKATPYAVAYDFDYAGLVDADYAVPDANLPIESVTQRVYRGFTRTMEELEPVVQKFKDNKEGIYNIIRSCSLLQPSVKKKMESFLDEFFYVIERPSEVKKAFIDKARQAGGI